MPNESLISRDGGKELINECVSAWCREFRKSPLVYEDTSLFVNYITSCGKADIHLRARNPASRCKQPLCSIRPRIGVGIVKNQTLMIIPQLHCQINCYAIIVATNFDDSGPLKAATESTPKALDNTKFTTTIRAIRDVAYNYIAFPNGWYVVMYVTFQKCLVQQVSRYSRQAYGEASVRTIIVWVFYRRERWCQKIYGLLHRCAISGLRFALLDVPLWHSVWIAPADLPRRFCVSFLRPPCPLR